MSQLQNGTPDGELTDGIFVPDKAVRRVSASSQARHPRELPPDMVREAVHRLRILLLIFAALFFLSNFLQPLLMGRLRAIFAEPERWLPGTLSIVIALFVFALCPRIEPRKMMTVGLVWEIVGSIGISLAQYWGIYRGIEYSPGAWGGYGLSWVAVWVVFFTIVVPNLPWRAGLAAGLSLASVPVVVALSIRFGGTTPAPSGGDFFFALVFPYLLVLLTTYIGARVVYRMGTEVTRARELGSYRLMERLGSGGMGEVWRASHRMLARPAAIKFIRPEALGGGSADESRRTAKRFELEAHATAALHSPHTVALYDFGETSEGTLYYVMELLHGVDLDALVRRFGPLDCARAVALLRQVCESLDEAHSKGLVHRDIKPANVYACRMGNRHDFVKVLDFGLVKKDLAQRASESRLTMRNVALGTPGFLPPEMATAGEVDARTDLYALGCVAFWLVTGRLVFEGTTFLDVVSKHLHAAPDPPSARSEFALPTAFDAIVLDCLQKDPGRRPQSAHQLAQRLDALAAEHPWSEERAARWWQAHLPEVLSEAVADSEAQLQRAPAESRTS